jgi:hypothetical protein
LYSAVTVVNRSINELKTEIESLKTNQSLKFERLGRQVRRIALQPIARVRDNNNNNNDNGVPNNNDNDNNSEQANNNNNNGRQKPAILSKTPRTLDELWIEFQLGIGGRKAAKSFTRVERGKCRHTYYRRNVFWTLVCVLIRAGENAQGAIDRIRGVYGESTSVTRILNKMLQDRKENGGHPQLRV